MYTQDLELYLNAITLVTLLLDSAALVPVAELVAGIVLLWTVSVWQLALTSGICIGIGNGFGIGWDIDKY